VSSRSQEKRLTLQRSAPVTIKAGKSLLDQLRALPNVRLGSGPRMWTDEEDAVLLEGRPRVGWGEIARLLGCCTDTAQARYKWLKEKEN